MSNKPPDATTEFEQALVTSIPRGWEGALLTALYKHERQPIADPAILKRMGLRSED
jgi:hypothetical protein